MLLLRTRFNLALLIQVFLASVQGQVILSPFSGTDFSSGLHEDELNKSHPLARRTTVASGTELRILPLGDSITYGWKSTTNNGYRNRLQEDLSGSHLQYVGSIRNGNMADNFNEGHPGATISQIGGYADNSLRDRPNIILLHAGTNDLATDTPTDPYATAPDRLGAVIDKLVAACPDAAILVAQIIHPKDPGPDARVQIYNNAVPGVVAQRANAGSHVMVVDMRSVTASYLNDSLHPTDQGYHLMGDLWFSGIQAADAKGWIKAPIGADPSYVSPAGTAKQQCAQKPFWYQANNGAQIAGGIGSGGNAKFTSLWRAQQRIAGGIGKNGTGVRFADIDGDGRDDYLWVNETSGEVTAYINVVGINPANFLPVNNGAPITSGAGPAAGVHFADINGDGRADYLYVNKDTGGIQAWINGGVTSTGVLWNGPTTIAAGFPNANQETVTFADINGDGRADYLVKGANGEVNLWLNIGEPNSASITWSPYNQIAGGQGTSNIALADINGDGRADYLMWDNDGGLSGFLNIRSSSEGQPVWVSQGPAKSIAAGLAPPGNVRLADINGDGKVDYCIVGADGSVDVLINGGSADTSVTGDGTRFADINGDGVDDYLFVGENGELTAYVNGGPTSTGWLWLPQYHGNQIANGAGAKRNQIHLADINGDGRADYLIVDPVTGAVTCYYNGGPIATGWDWNPAGQIASGFGPGAGVRFADIDGDGRADYIWLSESGAATVHINRVGQAPDNWIPLNNGQPIAGGVGGYRKDIRFADINGDGRADYVWVHPVDGSVDVWINQVGSNRAFWNQMGNVAGGVGFSGACIQFGRLDHTGRASYIPVVPNTGGMSPWLNGCGGVT